MRNSTAPFLLVLIAGQTRPAQAADTQTPPHPLLQEIAAQVRPAELQATIGKLVGFGTRHTLSDTHSRTRGIGAAREWVKGRFAEISHRCGGCLELEAPAQLFTGERLPAPTEIVDVLAVQHGTTDPQRV